LQLHPRPGGIGNSVIGIDALAYDFVLAWIDVVTNPDTASRNLPAAQVLFLAISNGKLKFQQGWAGKGRARQRLVLC
jgi:hypothetical protein